VASGAELLRGARRVAGLSQAEFAARGGTSRPTLSAYERGRKSPSLETFERLLTVAGTELEVRPRISFRAVTAPRGRVLQVPNRLPRLEPEFALRDVELPVALNWSQPGRVFRPVERSDRARLYEVVLREGGPDDVLRYLDGVLLVDIWDELVLPRYVRVAWDPLIRTAIDPATTTGAAS
jgi:transcriptional regulator with XRE-family HTH domain